MKVRMVLRWLREDGWYVDHVTGSHRQFRHPVKPGLVTVAGKESIDLNPSTFSWICRQAGWPKTGRPMGNL
ncbi:MAG: type II toxin-antitoxin system HicA family toxin [Candidatus Eremiobacteraeota bacterium]|nr:type II toxin-antitoxin system HicA family toxin [Candidatus Eremiobacteraeota bacterium]